MARARHTSRKPWLLVLACAVLFAGVCLWWATQDGVAPEIAAPSPPGASAPTPVARSIPSVAQPTPAPPPASAATLVVHLISNAPMPSARLVWSGGSAIVPATLAFASGEYDFHVEADEYLSLERRTEQLCAGEVQSVTFTLTPAAALGVTILANIRGGLPPGARLSWRPAESLYHAMLREAQPPVEIAFATDTRRIGPLYPGAPYELIAGASGCLNEVRTVVAGQVEATTFYLNTGGVIAGYLLDAETGQRVAHRALVLWGHEINPATAVTTATGEFRFAGVWPGEYRFELAQGPGILLESQGTERPILLRMAEHREDVTLVIGPGGTIRARLLNPSTGALWKTADLVPQGESMIAVAMLGATGKREETLAGKPEAEAVFADLQPGSYHLKLVGNKIVPDAAHRLDLSEGETKIVEWTVAPGKRIAGMLLDAAGAPVPEATVAFYRENEYGHVGIRGFFGSDQSKTRAPTSATGYFEAAALEPGFYTLVADPQGHTPGVLPHVITGRDDVELRLPRGGRLELMVYLPDGSPARGLAVRVEQDAFSSAVPLYQETVRLDSAGRATLERLPAGTYDLRNTDRIKWFTRTAQVEDGETTRVVVGGPGVALEGRVEMDGEPAKGLYVWFAARRLYRQDTIAEPPMSPPEYRASNVDEAGNYHLSGLPPGSEGWITVIGEGRPKYPYHVPCMLPESGTRMLHLRFDTGILRGTVHSANGLPLGNLRIELLPVLAAPRDLLSIGGEEILSRQEAGVRSDRSGRFMFSDIPPGRYLVAARRDEQVLASAEVEMPKNAREQEVALEAAGTGTLTGRATGAAREMLANTVIFVRDERGVISFLGLKPARRDTPDGTFVSQPMPAGKYRAGMLSIINSDPLSILCPDREAEVEVEAGAETYVEFHLRYRYAVAVQCVDADTGRPVSGVEITTREARLQMAAVRELFPGWYGFLPAGKHELRATAAGYDPTRFTVNVDDNSPTQHVTVKMPRSK